MPGAAAASTSVTKNALPPVAACSPSALRPTWRASSSTARGDNGASSILRTASAGSADSTARASA
jgi:hypothetical protein